MATTTNYGWTTPNDTDLVRNGASAIRTLGSAIDTTVFNNANAAVQKTLVDAKGDLITATAADTPARLAVGSNGDTLVADSAATTGLRWQGNICGGKNAAINGAIEIAQRGTSVNIGFGAYYGPDRFYTNSDSSLTGTISQQTFTPGTVVNGMDFQNFLRTNVTAVSGGSFLDVFAQKIENVRTFAGQTITISFWAKAASSGTYNLFTAQEFGTGGSSTVFSNQTVSITTSWQRFSTTFTLGSMSGKTIGANSSLTVFLRAPSVSTLTFEMTGLQVELGSVATTFSRAAGTLQGELAACQRYYVNTYPEGVAPGTVNQTGVIYRYMPGVACTGDTLEWNLPVTMRATPTVTSYSPNNGTINKIFNHAIASDTNSNALSTGIKNVAVYYTQSSGAVQASVHLVASAEL